MTHVTCRLTAKNRAQLRNPAHGDLVWTTFRFFYYFNVDGSQGSVRCHSHRSQIMASRRTRYTNRLNQSRTTDVHTIRPITLLSYRFCVSLLRCYSVCFAFIHDEEFTHTHARTHARTHTHTHTHTRTHTHLTALCLGLPR